MKRLWLGIGAAIFLLGAAYFLRDAIYQTVIIPLAYLFWLAKFYYSAVPQVILWGLLLVILFMIVFSNLLPEFSSSPKKEPKHGPENGQVETLARWIVKSEKGTYFKWQIANRLGRIELGLRETSERRSRFQPVLSEVEASRNDAVEKYLEAGVNTSFVDYPNRKSASTPLDVNPKEVVDYLETQLEMSRGRHP